MERPAPCLDNGRSISRMQMYDTYEVRNTKITSLASVEDIE